MIGYGNANVFRRNKILRGGLHEGERKWEWRGGRDDEGSEGIGKER